MRSEGTRARTDRSDRTDRTGRRSGRRRNGTTENGTTTTERDGKRAVRTLQQTLGNQAVQGLRESGELGRFLQQRSPGERPGGTGEAGRPAGPPPTSKEEGATVTTEGRPPAATEKRAPATTDEGPSARVGSETPAGRTGRDVPPVHSGTDAGPEPGMTVAEEPVVDVPAVEAAVTETSVNQPPATGAETVEPTTADSTMDGSSIEASETAGRPDGIESDTPTLEPERVETEPPTPEPTGVERETPAGESTTVGEREPVDGAATELPTSATAVVETPANRSQETGPSSAVEGAVPAARGSIPGTAESAGPGPRVGESDRDSGTVSGGGGTSEGHDSGHGVAITPGAGGEAVARSGMDASAWNGEDRRSRPPIDRRTDEDRGPPPAGSRDAKDGPSPRPGATAPKRPGPAAAVEEPLEQVERSVPETETGSERGRAEGARTTGTAGTAARATTTSTDDRPRPVTAVAPVASTGAGAVTRPPAPGIQTKLTVGRRNDRFEREADAVAAAVTADRPPPGASTITVGRFDGTASPRFEEKPSAEAGPEPVQTRPAIGGPGTGRLLPSTTSTIRNPGPGRPMPQGVRRHIEPRLGTSLKGVQVHAGGRAASAAGSIGARAFTHRNHVFLGSGESAHDVELMAHEATHVVQQGATAGGRRSSGTPSADVQPLFGVKDAILEKANEYARYIPGWTLFTVAIGTNPLTGDSVEPTPTNLVQGALELVPAIGPALFDAIQEYGVLEEASTWIRDELGRLDLTISRIDRIVESIWERISLPPTLAEVERIGREEFGPLIADAREFVDSAVDAVIDLIKDALVGVAEDLLANSETLSGAWELLKKVLGKDPLRDEEVDATPTEILEDFLLLIGQEEHLRQMRERGTLEQTAEWIAGQIERFQGLLARLSGLVEQTWQTVQPENLADIGANVEALVGQVGTFLRDVTSFAWDVAREVLERIKDALLGWLADYANQVPGFHLVTVIIGKNPFTREPVPRTAANLIRGFITLLPGGAGIYQQLAESGVVEGAAGRIEKAMSELGITWEFVVGLFTDLWESLSIEDLASPLETFARIVDRFGEPISRLFAFVNVVLREVFFLLLQLMNFPIDIVERIVTNAMAAIEDIKRDPVGFLTNMLTAIKLGFQSFFGNVLTHLMGGLADWLFRGLRDAGVEPPTDLSLESVLDLVLEVLGVTTERLWELLAERIGQENVDRIRGAIDRLTGILEFVGDVQERGAVAIWEYVQGQITGLWDMIIEKARAWIMERVISRAVQWLMSLLDPSGIMAVVNSVRSFIAAIQSAVEYARDILAIVADYTSTIAAVARGEVGPGAEKLEQGLANAIPVAIGFLMNQLGLGNVGEKIQEIIAGLREMVDRALSWLIDRAVGAVESLLRTLGFGGEEEGIQEASEPTDEEIDATDHMGVARRAVQEIESVSLSGEYTGIRSAVEERARGVENYWSPRLESGIGLTVKLLPPGKDREDGDIDFHVIIAPNNTEASGTVEPDEEPSGSDFVGKKVPQVTDDLIAAGYNSPYRNKSGTWVVAVPKGNPDKLPRLTTKDDGVTIKLASSKKEPSPAGEVFFDPKNFVAPPRAVVELFKTGKLDGPYRLSRSRYRSGLKRFRPNQAEAKRHIESLITGAPVKEWQRREESSAERDADELLRAHGMLSDESTSEDIYSRGERRSLEESETGEVVPGGQDATSLENTTAMSIGLIQEFLDAWFANDGWPPGWQVDHALEVRFGGEDTPTNYAPLPPYDHSQKTSWANELAAAVLSDPEIRAAFEELGTAEAQELDFEP